MTQDAIRTLLLQSIPSEIFDEVLNDARALRPLTVIGVIGVLRAHEVEPYIAEGALPQDVAEAVVRYLAD